MPLIEGINVAIEAEARLAVATVQLARVSLPNPTDHIRYEQDTYRLDLGLTPRPNNAQAWYRDRWKPRRFERIGEILVLPPGETVETRSDAIALQRSVLCYLRPEPMREWFDGDLEWTDRRLVAGLDIRDGGIRQLMLRLAVELQAPGLASEALMGAMSAQLALELGRYCAAIRERPRTGGLAAWRLRLIDERLREAQTAPTLPELARLCDVSVSALTRGFRASKGMSIGDYVANHQLDHAKRMLAAGESVKAVAYALGFASSASFCHAFRRASGETPGQFRDHVKFAGRLSNSRPKPKIHRS